MQGDAKVKKKKCVHLGIFARKTTKTTHLATYVTPLGGSESVDPRVNGNIPRTAVHVNTSFGTMS